MTEDTTTIIVDNGSGFIKAGLSVDVEPKTVFSAVVGTPGFQTYMDCEHEYNRRMVVGDEAQRKREILHLDYPIEHGIITDFSSMEKIWHHTFYHELQVDPEKYPVLLTEALFNPEAKRDKMMQIMFEGFNTPALRIDVGSVLSLRAYNKTTGVVLDCGDCVSSIVPIYEGRVLEDECFKLCIGGRDLTDYLTDLLRQRGFLFSLTNEREIARNIKENFCCVALDFEQKMADYQPSFWHRLMFSKSIENEYQLPDGQVITMGNEVFRCPEALFQPSFLHRKSRGIHEITYDCIMKCGAAQRNALLNNIVLSGGTTICTGFRERMQKEISALNIFNCKINIIADPKRKYSAWRGGAVLASERRKEDEFMTKSQYNELGRPAIHSTPFLN